MVEYTFWEESRLGACFSNQMDAFNGGENKEKEHNVNLKPFLLIFHGFSGESVDFLKQNRPSIIVGLVSWNNGMEIWFEKAATLKS